MGDLDAVVRALEDLGNDDDDDAEHVAQLARLRAEALHRRTAGVPTPADRTEPAAAPLQRSLKDVEAGDGTDVVGVEDGMEEQTSVPPKDLTELVLDAREQERRKRDLILQLSRTGGWPR